MEQIISKIKEHIDDILDEKQPLIVAIDGRCGAGKSTISDKLKNLYSCNLIHMDDFFLRPEQRTKSRLNQPGGNIDCERFLSEVILPLTSGVSFSYRPFSCSRGNLIDPVTVLSNRLTIVEGTYSLHPFLRKYYDLKIFLSTDKCSQIQRITKRNGPLLASRFTELWIPLEEAYFADCDVVNGCDLFFET